MYITHKNKTLLQYVARFSPEDSVFDDILDLLFRTYEHEILNNSEQEYYRELDGKKKYYIRNSQT